MAKDKRNDSGGGNANADRLAAYLAGAIASKVTGGIVASKGGSSGNDIGGLLTRTLLPALGKIIALVGPLAVLGSIITSNISGLQVFLSSMKLLSTLLGAFLAPVFLSLSAAVIAVTTLFEKDLVAAAKGWAEFIFKNAIGAVKAIETAFYTVAEIALDVAKGFEETYNSVQSFRDMVDGIVGLWKTFNIDIPERLGNLDPLAPGNILGAKEQAKEPPILVVGDMAPGNKIDDAKAALERQKAKGSIVGNGQFPKMDGLFPNGIGGGGGITEEFKKGLKMSMDELRSQNGATATSTDLIGASKAAQMAAFNQSPFESKMIDITQKMLGALEEALNKALTPAVAN